MQYLLSAREMKQIDKNTIEVFGVPSLVLMERAALCVVEVIKKGNSRCEENTCSLWYRKQWRRRYGSGTDALFRRQ